jgi:hypothetical protein
MMLDAVNYLSLQILRLRYYVKVQDINGIVLHLHALIKPKQHAKLYLHGTQEHQFVVEQSVQMTKQPAKQLQQNGLLQVIFAVIQPRQAAKPLETHGILHLVGHLLLLIELPVHHLRRHMLQAYGHHQLLQTI